MLVLVLLFSLFSLQIKLEHSTEVLVIRFDETWAATAQKHDLALKVMNEKVHYLFGSLWSRNRLEISGAQTMGTMMSYWLT